MIELKEKLHLIKIKQVKVLIIVRALLDNRLIVSIISVILSMSSCM